MKTKAKTLPLFACLAAYLFVSTITSRAAISVVATSTAQSASSTNYLTVPAFSMGSGNALVVLYAAEGPTTAPTVTFNGIPLTGTTNYFFTNSTAQVATIFWAINPTTTSGDILVTNSANFNGGITVMSLGGVDSVRSTSGNAGITTSTLNLPYSGKNPGIVVMAGIDNRSGSGTGPTFGGTTGGGTNFTAYTLRLAANFSANSSSGLCEGYGTIAATSTTLTNTWTPGTGGSTSTRNAAALVAFDGLEFPAEYWRTGSGTWDIGTTANWTTNGGVGTTVYQEFAGIGSPVVFEDALSGSAPITVTLNSTVVPTSVLVSNSTKNYTISGVGSISGGGVLTKTGNGTLTLGTANAYSGGSSLNGGTTILSVANALGTAGNINFNGSTLQWASGVTDDITASRTVTVNSGGVTLDSGNNAIYFSAAIGDVSSTGSLTKTGSGTITLAGVNRYSGNTLISQGTLSLNGGSAILSNSPNIILSSGATLDAGGYSLRASVSQTLSGVGSVNGDLTVPASTKISPATSSTYGTLVFSNSLTVSGTLELNVTNASRDFLAIAGTLTVNPGSTINILAASLTNGAYKLIEADNGFGGSLGNFTLNYTQAGKSANLLLATDGSTNTIFLVIADNVNDKIKWAGVGADWDAIGTLNWLNGATPWAFTNGATVTFDDSGSAISSVALQAAVSPSAVIVSNTVDYTFADGTGVGGGKISGAATLTKRSSGALNVQTVNDTTGATVIEAGTVNVSGHLGSGSVTNNGSLVFQQADPRTLTSVSGTGSLSQSGSSTLTVSGAANYTGPTIITAGTLTFGTGGASGALSTSAISNDGTLILNSSTDWTYSMPDAGSGTLRKQGSNTLTLSGSNARTGLTRVDNGKLLLANANQLSVGTAQLEGTGSLDMNGKNQLLLNLNGGGGFVVNNSGSATNFLTVSNIVAGDASAVVKDNDGTGGIVALVKKGSAQLTWRGANTYSGGTSIEEGSMRILSTGAFGTGPVDMKGGTINFAGGSFTNIVHLLPPGGATTNTINNTGNQTFVAPLVGTQDLIINPGGGTFRVQGGAAQWAAVTNTLYLRGSGFFRSQSGTDLSSVTVDMNDSSVQINSDAARNIYLGALVGNTNTALLSAAGGSTFYVGAKGLSTLFAGRLGGANSFVKVGSGTLSLTGTNTASASLTVSNSTLALALDAAPASMTPITVISAATLDVTSLADLIVETNDVGVVTNSYYVTNATLSLGTGAIAQTLRGGGTVNGSVLIGTNATVSPGLSIDTLTINNGLTINGTATMELNRTNSQTADRINAASYSGTGTVNVTNIGPDLITGDTFQLFGGAVAGVTVNLPVSNLLNTVQYVWTNKVSINGSIHLLSGASPVNPNPGKILSSYNGGVLSLSWPTNGGWTLQAQTNSLSSGISTNWVDIPGSANTTSTNITVDTSKPAVFYRLKL